jgi:hypothetical protein
MNVDEPEYRVLRKKGVLITRWFSFPGELKQGSLKLVVY